MTITNEKLKEMISNYNTDKRDYFYWFDSKLKDNHNKRQCFYVFAKNDKKAIEIAKILTQNRFQIYYPHRENIKNLNPKLDAIELNALKKGFHIWKPYKE